MGWFSRFRDRVASWISRDTSQGKAVLARGYSPPYLTYGYEAMYGVAPGSMENFLFLQQDLLGRYREYEAMDDYDLVAAVLNLYANEATQPNTPTNRRLWITSPDRDVQRLLDDFVHRQIRLEDDLPEIARSTFKMGSDYEEIVLGPDGVVGLNHLPAYTMRRIEGIHGFLYGFIQDFQGKIGYSLRDLETILSAKNTAPETGPDGVTDVGPPFSMVNLSVPIGFEPWQVAQFRVRSKHRQSAYGWCVPGETLVTTPSGGIPIAELRVGDDILSAYGHIPILGRAFVRDKVCSGTRPTLELQTALHSVRATAEHPFLVQRRGSGVVPSYDWVPLGEVKVGDLVFVQDSFAYAVTPTSSSPTTATWATPVLNGSLRLEKVLRVSAFGDEVVYDIQVDGPPNFLANGVVVHNSILEPARWVWRRLRILEDAALIYRLQRSPERFAFYVGMGNKPPAEAMAMLNKIRQEYKKEKVYNPVTGELSLRMQDLAADKDFFIPVFEGEENTRVELLSGPNWQSMDDIVYFQNKFFGCLLVPKAYFSQEEGIQRQILSSQDVQFAQTVMRNQLPLIEGVEKICRVHLAAIGIPPDHVDFSANLTIPSAVFELSQMEVQNARQDLCARMRENTSLYFALSKGMGLGEDEIQAIMTQRDSEAMAMAKQQAAANNLMAPPDMSMESVQEPRKVAAPAAPKPITEEVLFAGSNKATERRASAKLDELLRSTRKSDRQLITRLNEVRTLVQQIGRAKGRA